MARRRSGNRKQVQTAGSLSAALEFWGRSDNQVRTQLAEHFKVRVYPCRRGFMAEVELPGKQSFNCSHGNPVTLQRQIKDEVKARLIG